MGQAFRHWAVIPASCADDGAPCKPPARQRVDLPGSLFEVSVEDCTNRVVTSPLIADVLVRHPDRRKCDGRRESTCRFRLAQQHLGSHGSFSRFGDPGPLNCFSYSSLNGLVFGPTASSFTSPD